MRTYLFVSVLLSLIHTGCGTAQEESEPVKTKETVTEDKSSYDRARREMVDRQIRRRGISNERVLAAMEKVERHKFVPPSYLSQAYSDYPLPIGEGQTISQPYIVAYMTEILNPTESMKVLEIGTGSGYQAAILGELVKEVYTIEIVEKLGAEASVLLKDLGYDNVHVKIGDGYKGWPEHAPFDGIIVTAAPDHVPQPLVDQLAEGGRMIIPVGEHPYQELKLITKKDGKVREENMIGVLFVPMTGQAQHPPR